MQQSKVIGLDLAKNVFQVHVADGNGYKKGGRQLKRKEVLDWFGKQERCLVGLEACGGAHEWARQLVVLGFEVKMMAPQHVKPYVQGNKTDARDAAAIAEAAQRGCVRSVTIRTVESQQMQAEHKSREMWVKQRTMLSNHIRGLLAEYGAVAPKGYAKLREMVREWLAKDRPDLVMLKELLRVLLKHWQQLDELVSAADARIMRIHRQCPASKLIESIPGVGVMTATAIIACYGMAQQYGSARQFSCSLGLTPREHSSGGKQKLGGISKRGNGYIRRLLVTGANSVLRVKMNNPKYENDWEVQLAKRRGKNIAAVALAAKNARRIWAMLGSGEVFRRGPIQAAEVDMCA